MNPDQETKLNSQKETQNLPLNNSQQGGDFASVSPAADGAGAGFISLAEASKQTGYHQDYLGYLCRNGKLSGFKVGRNWLVTQAELDRFIKNYKNGINEVTDEAGKKIQVHVAAPVLPAAAAQDAVPVPVPLHVPQPLNATSAPGSVLNLSHLRREVVEGLESRVAKISEQVSEAEVKLQEQFNSQRQELDEREKQLRENLLEQAQQQEKTMAAPQTAAAEQLPPRQPLHEQFASNLNFSQPQPEAAPRRKSLSEILDAGKAKQLLQSFTAGGQGNKKTLAVVTAVVILGFAASVTWGALFGRSQGNPYSETKIVYNGGAAPQGRSVFVQNGATVKNITQVLGPDNSQLAALVDRQLDNYLAEGKFTGPQGDAGTNGANASNGGNGNLSYAPISYVQPADGNTTDTTGSVGGFTDLSASTLSASLANIATLNVQGGATLGGNTSISNLDVGSINPGFTQGSVVFQGSSGLAQDNGNLVYSASTTQLSIGTSTPNSSAVLELDSTSAGFLAPRMSLAQINAIVNPAAGLMVFNTDSNQYNVYDGFTWGAVGGGGNGNIATGTPGAFAFYPQAEATIAPQSVLFVSGGNIGIGSSSPAAELAIVATASPENLFEVASTSGQSLLTVDDSGNIFAAGSLNVSGTSTLATTTATALTVQSLNGNTILNGSGSLALVGSSTVSQISLNGNGNTLSLFGNSVIDQNLSTTSTPAFAGLTSNGNFSASGTSTLATTTITALSAQTLNGNTIQSGTGALNLGNNSLTLSSGNTVFVGGNSVSSSTISQVTLSGNNYSLTLFGNSVINQNLSTTSTPAFAGLTSNGTVAVAAGYNLMVAKLPNCNNASAAIQTDASGNLVCGTVTAIGGTSAGGWTWLAPNTVRLATSTDLVGIGALAPTAKLTVDSTASATPVFSLLPVFNQTADILDIFNTSGATTSVVTAGGYFGINTTSPVSQLSVGGDSYFNGNLTATGNGSIGGSLNVSGPASAASLLISGNATTTGNLIVLGNASITGISTLATTTIAQLTVSGSTTLSSLGSGVVRSSSGGLYNGLVGNSDLVNSSVTLSTTTQGLTGGGLVSLGGTVNIGLASTGTPGSYGSANQIPVLSTNQFGEITGVTNTNVIIASTSVTGLGTLAGLNSINNSNWSGAPLAVSNGGTGTNTLGSLTVGSNLAISGGQNVLIGTSTQITLSANPLFNSITATATSSLGSASSTALTVNGPAWITGMSSLATTSATALTANTFNGITLNAGTGALALNNNTLSVQGGNTSLIGGNTITASVVSTSTISQVTVNGNGNTLSLFGSSSINQNLTTTSTPSFAGLTVNGNATTTGSSALYGPLSVITTQTPQLNLGYNAGNYWSSTVASTGGLTLDGNGSSTSFTVMSESSSVSDSYTNQAKISNMFNTTLVNGGGVSLVAAVCGSYSISGAGGLTYGTVLGADGNCWLDRNLGATEVASSQTDTNSYGYYYQWGRGTDGHQISTSTATTTLASTATPGNADFIESPSSPYDWVSPQINTLWQSPSYVNNPCPSGFYLPTQTQWATLVTDAGITNSATAFSSSLKLTLAGYRISSSASLNCQGSDGYYWSSSPNGTLAYYLSFGSSSVSPASNTNRAYGFSVRCVQ